MVNRKHFRKVAYHLFCFLLALFMLYPMLWMFFSSFKSSEAIFTTASSLFPSEWVFSNYPEGWKGFGGISFSTFFSNTFYVVILATLGAVVSSSFVAYGFARIRFTGSGFWFACMMLSLMLPFQIVMIPQFLLFNSFGWIGTYLPLIVPFWFGQPFFIFLDVQFIRGLPIDLDESARIDGCGHFRIFMYIILPLIVPALVTGGIFSFIWRWEDFVAPLIYLNKPSKYGISLALKNFSDPSSMSNWGGMFAMSVLSLVPAFVIYIVFQKYLVEGIATSGMKV